LARDWNRHYTEISEINLSPDPLVVEVADILPPGRALDLACGAGRNTLHLARLGWRVTAVDASSVAINYLRGNASGLKVDARVADLEAGEFTIESGGYDLVCDFFYLQRSLFPAIREGVSPGGVFAGAIHLFEDKPESGRHNPEYLLQPGELRRLFAGWKILYYSEARRPSGKRPAARIIAKRQL
jgi:SAM-dependent methyltransferase